LSRPVALITGAAGFCGGRLAELLAGEGTHRVVGTGRTERPGAWETFHAVDLRDREGVRRLVEAVKPDLVFHLAGRLQGDGAALIENNALPTLHLCEAILDLRPEARLVLAGSSAEYGVARAGETPLAEDSPCEPEAFYGISKLTATLVARGLHRRRGLKLLVARPSNVVGPGMPAGLMLGSLLRQVADCVTRGAVPAVRLGNTYPRRDFIDVADVCRGYLQLATQETWGTVYNLSSGRCVSVQEIIRMLGEVIGEEIRVDRDEALVRPGEPEALCFSHEAAARTFGFAPQVSLEASLRAMWKGRG
jgi:GDP-4-dehydro-6-deoxy-D-mannose reductase